MADLREEIRAVAKELSYPSAPKLRAALVRRGIRASLEEVRDYTRGLVSRQVFQRVPTTFGKILAYRPNERWAADLIDFTASPDGDFRHVLVVQDLFTRKLYTAPLKKNDPEEVLRAFRGFVRQAGEEPRRLDTDAGPEFTKGFAAYVEEVLDIPQIVKDPADANALATLDRAIMTLKQDLARVLTEEESDDWVRELPRVTRAYNNRAHSSLFGASPDEARSNVDIQFSLQKQAIEHGQVNDALLTKRAKAVLDAGAFREAAKRDKFKRSFQPNWSKDVRTVAGVSLGRVVDDKGREVLLKRVLPVAAGTKDARLPRLALPGSAQTDVRQKALLEPFREKILDYVAHTSEALLENVSVRMRALGVPKIPGKTVRATLEMMGFRVVPRFPENPARGFVVRPPIDEG